MTKFDGKKLVLTDEEWAKRLSEEQYYVLKYAGTEPAFKNAYHANKEHGVYACGGCSLPLFHSDNKFDSGSCWPSFWQPIYAENISTKEDNTLLSSRIEVVCSKCDGHLGHVFPDGPEPTGLRYCINSAALKFTAKD